jgi:hypothetical protein
MVISKTEIIIPKIMMAIKVGDIEKVYQVVKFDAIEQNGGRL